MSETKHGEGFTEPQEAMIERVVRTVIREEVGALVKAGINEHRLNCETVKIVADAKGGWKAVAVIGSIISLAVAVWAAVKASGGH